MRTKKTRFSSLVLAMLLGAIAIGSALASVDGVISSQVTGNDRRTVGLNTSANLSVNTSPSIPYTNGAGANQANVLYQASLALSGGAYSLDLNGAVTDSYGTSVALVRIKAVYIKNTATTALTVGAGSTPITTLLNSTGTLTLPPSAWVTVATPDATGWAVTASTADCLNFTGTGSGTFQVVVLGSST